MHHKSGFWNVIWSDMYIETTFMRYGHGPGGLVGIILFPSAVKRWALSLHICNRLINDVVQMRDAYTTSQVTTHKEEMPAQIGKTSKQVTRKQMSSLFNRWLLLLRMDLRA